MLSTRSENREEVVAVTDVGHVRPAVEPDELLIGVDVAVDQRVAVQTKDPRILIRIHRSEARPCDISAERARNEHDERRPKDHGDGYEARA